MLTASRMVTRPGAAASPFIGREKEMAELQRRLHAAVAGECQLAVIAGEPGIGKTRLVEQLLNLARARKIRVLSGRFVEQDRAFAHQGFCELIQDYFKGKDTGASAASQPDLTDVAGDLIGIFPVLAEIGELRAAASGSDAGGRASRAEDKTAVFELIAKTLTRLGHGKPLVLVLEELHGAEQSIEALQYVARRLAPTPTLILGTYRPTEVDKRHQLSRMLESFRGDPRFASITLGAFTASEHRALVELVAGGGAVADGLAKRLYEATEGNPLFTKELVRSLLDSGGIARDQTGALRLSGAAGISSDALPETIQQAVSGRVARLPEELREVLSIASVLGKSFEMRDLEMLAEGRDDLDESVERLVNEGLLQEETSARADRLAFSSGIVRDVLYNAVSRRKRKLLHKKYALLLEKRNAGRLERAYPELLHHFSEADVPEKAVEYGLLLARKSLEAFSADEASRAARVVLDFAEGAEESEDGSDVCAEGEARLVLAGAASIAGQTDVALQEAEAASKVFDREKKPARSIAATLLAAECAWQARRVDEARRWVERGLPQARGLSETDALVKLLSISATVAGFRGEHHQAATLLLEIERLAPRAKEREDLERGGTLVVALANPVRATEPHQATLIEEIEVFANVYETLVTTDARGNLTPSLAERWDVLEAGHVIALTLRRDLKFSDGEPLTAAAVKASFERSREGAKDELPAALAAIADVEAPSDHRLVIRLVEPLPIFPSLLTDSRASVTRATVGERIVGTGPFEIASHAPDRVVLRRNAHAAKPPLLDSVEFRAGMSASAIASGLREGRVELARDLLPEDLDVLLREPRFRAGLVEAPKKGTYLALFNVHGPLGQNAALRRALAGVTRSHDFVWAALGRVALPATGILPPGILGHDAGRRRGLMSIEDARNLLAEAGLTPPIAIRATVHPILQDRFRALLSKLFDIWRELGVEVTIENADMADYLEAQRHPTGDLQIGRWVADYDDPDDFTHSLFNGTNGNWKAFYSSEPADRMLEDARKETSAPAREALYRRFEELLLGEAVMIPLFHEIDYRIAAPTVRGVELSTTPPFVSYAQIGKVSTKEAPRAQATGGIVTIPIAGDVTSLDPTAALAFEVAECVSNVFETLTRNVEGKIVPWLASEVEAEQGGALFRFRLRRGVRFHDGRPLTSRDVRYSFERVLQSQERDSGTMLAPVKGAAAVMERKVSDLAGFRILSPSEFVIELEKPLSFFPAMLSYATVGIVPEGTTTLGGHWSEGSVGTGPFRIVRFVPGKLLELERNPAYWREGRPKAEGLVFRLRLSPEEIKREFLAGRLAVASDLLPQDAEAFRSDPRFASGYREAPKLGTYLILLNARRGPLRNPETRRRVYEALDGEALVRRTLGRMALPATGLIPPGLLGHAPASGKRMPPASRKGEPLTLTALTNPIMWGEYAALYKGIEEDLAKAGITLKPVNTDMSGYIAGLRGEGADLMIGRWNADYFDSDNFVYMVHSKHGVFGGMMDSREIDRLAERGRAESDPSIRHAVYRQAEDVLASEALLVPLFHEPVYRFARPDVQGLRVSLSIPYVAYDELSVRA
jgi:ABC-type transport system substrate-binding protein